MPKKAKEEDLPYAVREGSDEVVEVVQFEGPKKIASHGMVMKDDLVGVMSDPSLRLVSRFGVIQKFDSPSDLYYAGLEYFKWAVENPIEKEEMIKGGPMAGETGSINVPRPFSVVGLRTYLGITARTWKKYKEDPIFSQFEDVVEFFEDVCRTQKLENAMVGHYNATLVSKDLGMVDKSESKNETINTTIVGMRIMID